MTSELALFRLRRGDVIVREAPEGRYTYLILASCPRDAKWYVSWTSVVARGAPTFHEIVAYPELQFTVGGNATFVRRGDA